MELITVRGNIEDINNYANLYQKFSSIGSKTVDLARKQFMDSELGRYIKGPEVVGSSHISVQEMEEEVSTIDYVGHGVLLDEVQDEVVEQDVGNEVIKEYVNHGIMLDKEVVEDIENMATLLETYTPHGVMLDEITSDEGDIRVGLSDSEDDNIPSWDSDEDSEEGWGDEEESSWGSDESEGEEVVEINDGVTEEIESEWDSEDDNGESSWDSGESEGEWGSEEDDNQGWTSELEDTSDAVQNGSTHTLEERSETPVETESVAPVVIPEKKVKSEVRIPRFEQQRTLPNPKPPIKRVTENTQPSMDKTVIPKVNYANVRAYVKGNPGCTSAEVSKYFPASEIKKALMSSKVVEKKGKLYAV